MEIRLIRLKAENFKGQKAFDEQFGGNNAVITAENGVGKTTVYDMFLWLLFDKDSTGRSAFEVRPLDKHNQPIKGLVVSVEGDILLDGNVHTFRKEHHEKVVKGQLRGYETQCWIDEVPKKVSEYSDYIADIIAEDTFKLLTDLSYFNDDKRFHWTKRRGVLLDVAGKTGTPEGFDDLLEKLNGRNIDEYKKVLADQKKRHIKDRDEIGPRIDEIQRGLDQYVGTDSVDVDMLNSHRELINKDIEDLDKQRMTLFEQEKERLKKIEHLNDLKSQRSNRETELVNDTSNVKSLLDEKTKIETEYADKKRKVSTISSELDELKEQIKSKHNTLDGHLQSREEIRGEYTKVSKAKAETVCFNCNGKLPDNMIAESKQKQKAKLAEIAKRGEKIQKLIEDCHETIETLKETCVEKNQLLTQARADCKKAEEEKTKRLAEIDEAINNRDMVEPDKDPVWLRYTEQIEKTEAEIGPPASEQLQEIENQKKEKYNELEQVNNALAQSDRRKQDNIRIGELEELQKELAQKIADIERQLDDIKNFKAAQNALIEKEVNSKFKHVEFKLFKQLLNEETQECCEATLNGVPFADLSTGQKIFVGIDIVNVLSKHYGLTVPLFVDHSESMTLPIEANCQTIELYAQKGVKKLKVQTKIQKKKAVA